MIVVDLNLLVYATNRDAPLHKDAHRWWQRCLADATPIGLPWAVIVGFVRLSTNPRVMPRPLSPEQAFSVVDDWLAHPSIRPVEPSLRHWALVKELLEPLGSAGNLTTDAHIAAVAIEHGARLYSTDSDFARFPGLRWTNPLVRGARRGARAT